MSYLYILPLKDKTAFKIGVSKSPMKRITQLLNFYNVEKEIITIIRCSGMNEAFQLESFLHSALDASQVLFDYDGGTEFFKYSEYQSIMELCSSLCKFGKYSIVPFELDATLKPLAPIKIETNKFATLLKRKRLELNISQTELAKVSNVSKRTVERFEKTGQATFENVLQMFSALGIKDVFVKDDKPLSRKRVKKRKIFVGDSDHEPDKEWVQEISNE